MRTGSVSDRVAALPPGAELSAILAELDLSAVPRDQIVEVLQAQARQFAHEQARLLATMVEVSRTVPGGGARLRAAEAFPWAAGEVAAALTLTARAADREMGFAETVVSGLPVVFAALWAGRLDRAKAWVFADHLDSDLCGLTPAQIEAICIRLVPPAAGWTTGQLAARLLRAIIAIDPAHARRRYDKAVRERQVVGFLDDAGTVTITATGLPTDQAAAAGERLEQLAAAVKRAGHPGRVAQIQADVFLGLLDGRYHHATQEQIITDLLTRAGTDDVDSDGEPAPRCPPSPDDPAARPPSPRRPATPRQPPIPTLPPGLCHPPGPPRPPPRPDTIARGWRSASDCPPCSGSTTGLGRSPVSAR